MKTVLSIFSIAVFAVACNTNPSVKSEAQINQPDTAGLAEFQALKQQAALEAMVEEKIAEAPKTVVYAKPAVRKSTSSAGRTSTARSTSSASSAPVVMNSESENAAMEKKGWSKAAKGAVIGGVVGAGTGAVVHKKNRAAGAVVGGVVGAGGGYVIGRQMDKKDGRY